MRLTALPGLSMLICLCLAQASFAFDVPQIPFDPQCYNCPRAAAPPVLDGALDDAAWQQAVWTADFADIRGGAQPAPRFRTRAKMLWDDSCLYIGAELEEPQLQASFTQRDAFIYQLDNDFEVFIDPDGDSHLYYELELNALNTPWDLLLVKPYRDGGPAINGFDLAGLRSAVHLDGTLNDPADTDAGWSIEIAIPWGALADAAGTRCPPQPGDYWRMNFSRVEWRFEARAGKYIKELDVLTGLPYPEDNWVWSPQGLIAMHYPERWGYVVFCTGQEHKVGVPPFLDVEQLKAELYRIYYLEREYRERTGEYTADWQALGYDPQPSAGSEFALHLLVLPDAFYVELENAEGARLMIDDEGRLEYHP